MLLLIGDVFIFLPFPPPPSSFRPFTRFSFLSVVSHKCQTTMFTWWSESPFILWLFFTLCHPFLSSRPHILIWTMHWRALSFCFHFSYVKYLFYEVTVRLVNFESNYRSLVVVGTYSCLILDRSFFSIIVHIAEFDFYIWGQFDINWKTNENLGFRHAGQGGICLWLFGSYRDRRLWRKQVFLVTRFFRMMINLTIILNLVHDLL